MKDYNEKKINTIAPMKRKILLFRKLKWMLVNQKYDERFVYSHD